MAETKRYFRVCENCEAPCAGNFKKVATLQNSGLLIFAHKEKQTLEKNRTSQFKKEETFILHNSSDKELIRADYITEMSQYRTKCPHCRTVVQKVRSLLDEITNIKRNQVLGICEHCKHVNPSGKCRRCEYIVNKFLCNKVKHYEDTQKRLKSWLSKVNQLLHFILEKENVCKLYKDSSTVELEKLLQELKAPLEMRQPDITFYPMEPDHINSMTQSKEIIDKLLIKLKSESLRKRSSDDSMYDSPSISATGCVCKYFMDNKIKPTREFLPEVTLPAIESNLASGDSVKKASKLGRGLTNENKIIEIPSKEKAKTKSSKEKTSGKENVSPDTENVSPNKKLKKKEEIPNEKTTKEKKQKIKQSPEDEMFLKLLKNRDKEKQKGKPAKQEKVKVFAKVDPLPQLKTREVFKVVEQISESIVECSHEDIQTPEMIRGVKVIHFDPLYALPEPALKQPLFFKINAIFDESKIIKPSTVSTVTTTTNEKQSKMKKSLIEQDTKGIIKYKLSDAAFIENGWTILPTTKVMRRMNIYKMLPANPNNDWFKRHRKNEIMFYESGEKLAEIDHNARGKWFYKNGMVALDYYKSQGEEVGLGQRYVVYSSGEEVKPGQNTPVTVLACFDFLGNGIVYDHNGNERLKYNQTEGIVIDEKIGPSSRWKWHSLNEPPNLQPVIIDSHVKHRSPCIRHLFETNKEDKSEASTPVKAPNHEMLAIELDNFVKAKAHKLLQKYKPFQIRLKAFKVNDQFSLRILDQANIYLLFRDGQVSLKLNLGMLLINSEIIDTDITEVSHVVTPYDQLPPKSTSIAEIQDILKNARRVDKTVKTSFKSES